MGEEELGLARNWRGGKIKELASTVDWKCVDLTDGLNKAWIQPTLPAVQYRDGPSRGGAADAHIIM